MNTKRFKIRKSLILTCARHFLFYSLFLLLVYNVFNYFLYKRLSNAFPSMDQLLEYEEELKAEEFSQIPLSHSRQCSFVVFDGEGRTVYATSREITENIRVEDAELINEYYGDSSYSVYEKTNAEGETFYYIYLIQEEGDAGTTKLVASCVLDADGQIVEGDLFPDKQSLTETELNLVQGFYDANTSVGKYVYQTDQGEDRTVILVSPLINAENYEATVNRVNQLWLAAVPVVAAAAVVAIVLLIRNIKKSILPLNQTMSSYRGQEDFQVESTDIPVEFQSTVDSFSQLVDRLSAMQEEKEEMYREKQRMIADISHDLKTPLTVIRGYAKAILDGQVPEEKQRRYLETICGRAELAAGLLDSLFAYVRMEHPGSRPDKKEVDLGELVKEILAERYSEVENSGFHLEVNIPETPIPFPVDVRLFRRLLENLLGNTLKYNPAGTTFYVSLEETREQVILVAADDGVGIPPSIGRRVFAPFVTGSSARPAGEGTGLGLSIVKKIVELHGGTICLVTPPEAPFNTQFRMEWDRPGS